MRLGVFSRLFGKRDPVRRLKSADVRRIAEAFLGGWIPFFEKYGHIGPLSVGSAKDASGRWVWIASVTPARDVSCGVVVADELGEVIEARLVSLRGGALMAEWRR
jgi:hypothetical protein